MEEATPDTPRWPVTPRPHESPRLERRRTREGGAPCLVARGREVLVHPLDLARLVDARARQAGGLPRQLHAVERLEVVEPDRLGVVLGEEGLADPLLVTALQKAAGGGAWVQQAEAAEEMYRRRRTRRGRFDAEAAAAEGCGGGAPAGSAG